MSRKRILLICFIVSAQWLSAQKHENKFKEIPKYELRQKDFYEKRVSPGGETNFAEAFYKASIERDKPTRKNLNKKSNE